jgi:hypothetical protein
MRWLVFFLLFGTAAAQLSVIAELVGADVEVLSELLADERQRMKGMSHKPINWLDAGKPPCTGAVALAGTYLTADAVIPLRWSGGAVTNITFMVDQMQVDLDVAVVRFSEGEYDVAEREFQRNLDDSVNVPFNAAEGETLIYLAVSIGQPYTGPIQQVQLSQMAPFWGYDSQSWLVSGTCVRGFPAQLDVCDTLVVIAYEGCIPTPPSPPHMPLQPLPPAPPLPENAPPS